MTDKLRAKLAEVKKQKHVRFNDLDPIARKCLTEFPYAFPKQSINKSGSRVVYHFNVADLAPVSLEREHGSREFIPRNYVKLAIRALEDALTYIESLPEPATDGTNTDESQDHEGRENEGS